MIGTLSMHSIFCQLSKLWRSLYINSHVKSFLALIVAKVKWQTAKACLVGFTLTQIQMFLSNNSPKRSKWRLVKHRPITKNQANIFQSRVQRHIPPAWLIIIHSTHYLLSDWPKADSEITPLPVLLSAAFLGTENCSYKIFHGSFFSNNGLQ